MPKKLGEEEFDKLLELLREQLQLFGENPSLSSIAQRFLSGDKKQELKRIRGDVPQDGRWFRETPGFAYPSATPRREAPSFRRNDCELRLSTRSSFWGQGP